MRYENYNKRLEKALNNFAKSNGVESRLPQTLELLPKIIHLCGEGSNNRRAALRIGETILKSGAIKIIAPCCPDYSHRNGVYNFEALNSGISLLAQNQIDFLQNIQGLGTNIDVVFLYADQEADDDRLLKISNGNRELFLERVKNSVQATKDVIKKLSWQANLMTEFISDFKQKESDIIAELRENENLHNRITSETIQRYDMYKKIDSHINIEEARDRTIRTASHYLILGDFAKTNNYLISNHTTTNLAWYTETGAGILHNPVAIY